MGWVRAPPSFGKLPVVTIFSVNERDIAWSQYESDGAPTAIRFKALSRDGSGVPGVQYIEYGPGETDPVHQHPVSEVFIVMHGEMWVDDTNLQPGGLVFVPADTDYAVRAGPQGVRYFRIVTDERRGAPPARMPE